MRPKKMAYFLAVLAALTVGTVSFADSGCSNSSITGDATQSCGTKPNCSGCDGSASVESAAETDWENNCRAYCAGQTTGSGNPCTMKKKNANASATCNGDQSGYVFNASVTQSCTCVPKKITNPPTTAQNSDPQL